jgi:hypothetical protein
MGTTQLRYYEIIVGKVFIPKGGDCMKAYGVRRKDQGCCPGHDKYPDELYKNQRWSELRRKNADRARKKHARQEGKFWCYESGY